MAIGVGLLSGTAIAVMGTMVAVGGAVYEAGSIDVRVQEKHAHGTRIHVIAPAILTPVGLEFVPDKVFREHSREIQPWLPAIQAALQELQKYPDVTFVEVDDANDHVRISKQGKKLVVDVNSDEDVVHVSVPLSSIRSVMKRFEAANPGA